MRNRLLDTWALVGPPATFLVALLCLFWLLGHIEPLDAAPPNLTSYLSQTVRRPSGYVNAHVLAAGVAENETVPSISGKSGARVIAIFERGDCGTYYFHVAGAAAAEPSADLADGTASESMPTAFNLAEGDTFSIMATAACHMSIAYYPER